MLVIRFIKIGKRNQPSFRIVVTDKKNPPRGGRFVEIVGYFNPFTKEKKLKIERVKHWLSLGAQPSDRVHNLLVSEGVIKAKKRPVHAKPKKKEEEKPPKEAKPEPTAEVKKEEKKEEPKPETKPEGSVEEKQEAKQESK